MAQGLALGLMALAALVRGVWPVAAAGQEISATVLSIGDGDTIRVRQGGAVITVRLACVDAPETAQRPYGLRARTSLRQRLPIGRQVTLAVKATDRYGRTVAEVFSDININLALVEDGQAFAYRQYLGGCNAQEYLDAEHRASQRRAGVWQVPGGITRPWDFRRRRRSVSIPGGPPARTAAAMGTPANPRAAWVSGGTGTGTPPSHRPPPSALL